MSTRTLVLEVVLTAVICSISFMPCRAENAPGFEGLASDNVNTEQMINQIAELKMQVIELKELLRKNGTTNNLLEELKKRARIVAIGLIRKENMDRTNIQFDEIAFGKLIGPVPQTDDEDIEMSWKEKLLEIKKNNLGSRELVLRGIKCMASYRFIRETRKQRDFIQNDSIQFELKLSAKEYRQIMVLRQNNNMP